MNIDPRVTDKVRYLEERRLKTLANALGIEYLTLSPELVEASMPVDERTMQPFGILHGGASVALAESIASIGGWLNVDETKFIVVGLEINANHVRPMTSGNVIGRAIPLHIGKKTQVWDVKIVNSEEKLVCVSRCTLAVVDRTKP